MRVRLLVAVALASAVVGAVFPIWAPAALLTTVVATVALEGRARLVVGVVAGLLTTAGFLRFLVEVAAPNLVASGTKFTEEHAVSRLREVWFAQGLAREAKLVDRDGDGAGEFTSMDRLLDASGAFLRQGVYKPAGPGVWRVEGYDVAIYLPGREGPVLDPAASDPDLAEQRWIAYAWPHERHEGVRQRVFFIDQDERICEADNAQGYFGPALVPPPFAAYTQRSLEAATCMAGTDGATWRRWKRKKARE